jgi:hypothetical protein
LTSRLVDNAPALKKMRTGVTTGEQREAVRKDVMGQQQQDVCAGAAKLLERLLDITPGGQCTGPAMK